MQTCAFDLSPIILAIAAVISVQVPLLVSHFINASQARHDARTIKSVVFENREKVAELTFMTKNGFHGPPGPQGPPGPPASSTTPTNEQ